jgi:hypothetical protein
MSQFIAGMASSGDFGDGEDRGRGLFGDESGPEFYIPLIAAQINNCSLSCDSVVNAATKFQTTCFLESSYTQSRWPLESPFPRTVALLDF